MPMPTLERSQKYATHFAHRLARRVMPIAVIVEAGGAYSRARRGADMLRVERGMRALDADA